MDANRCPEKGILRGERKRFLGRENIDAAVNDSANPGPRQGGKHRLTVAVKGAVVIVRMRVKDDR